MFRNMVTSLFKEERVETTVPKAKEARRLAERMITHAKRGDLHARRQAARFVRDQDVLKKLFDEIGPRFAERPGGYTRILKTGFRSGDNAPLSILELLPEDGGARTVEPEAEAKGKKAKGKKKEEKAEKKSTKKAAAKKKSTKKAATKKAAKKKAAKKKA
jgi:large subunit ribosomal protein L17